VSIAVEQAVAGTARKGAHNYEGLAESQVAAVVAGRTSEEHVAQWEEQREKLLAQDPFG
jgi:hypothetical protein